MSNLYKHYHKQDYWLPASRIFFVDGEPAVNCLSAPKWRKLPAPSGGAAKSASSSSSSRRGNRSNHSPWNCPPTPASTCWPIMSGLKISQ